MIYKHLKNNVTAVEGFTAVGKAIGIKKGKKDFAIIFADKVCSAAGMFTLNKVKGAPIIVTQKHIANGKAQAIVVNSGCSNVATGKKGIMDAVLTAKLAAAELDINPFNVLVASTGIIGQPLPMQLIKKGISHSKKQLKKVNSAAEAILTTDLVKKEIAIKVGNCTMGAIAKGSGMIHPNMATMLCFITTDADFSSKELKKMLKQSVDESFNMVSVDMDTSTSDMVLLLSTNAQKISKRQFQDALTYVCTEIVKKVAADGEGATKLVEVNVKNAKSKADARKLAKSIVSSNLIKCALFGNSPNWGRIMCAAGYSGADFNQNTLDIYIQGSLICKNSSGTKFDPKRLSKLIKSDKVIITLDVKGGKEKATAWGCDLSYDYVQINADYN